MKRRGFLQTIAAAAAAFAAPKIDAEPDLDDFWYDDDDLDDSDGSDPGLWDYQPNDDLWSDDLLNEFEMAQVVMKRDLDRVLGITDAPPINAKDCVVILDRPNIAYKIPDNLS